MEHWDLELGAQAPLDLEAARRGDVLEVDGGPAALIRTATRERVAALGAISDSVKVGQTALLAVVDEPSTEVVAAAMADLGGTVARRSVADVEAEIAAAEDAERKAKQEARKELHRQKREQNKATVDAKVAELRTKLHASPSGSGR